MHIEKITYYVTNDGVNSVFNLILNIVNNSEFIVELVLINLYVLDKRIYSGCGYKGKSEVYLKSNDMEIVDFRAIFFDTNTNFLDKFKVNLDISTYYRNSNQLDITSQINCNKMQKINMPDSLNIHLSGLACFQTFKLKESDDEHIVFNAIFYNTIESKVKYIKLNLDIVDSESCFIGSFNAIGLINPNDGEIITIRCLDFKYSRIQNFKIRLTLITYYLVAKKTISCSALRQK